MPAKEFQGKIISAVGSEIRQEKRVDEILSWISGDPSLITGFDVFVQASNYASTRGYAAAVDKILNPTLDKIFEEVKNAKGRFSNASK
jgi:hypothetical protein